MPAFTPPLTARPSPCAADLPAIDPRARLRWPDAGMFLLLAIGCAWILRTHGATLRPIETLLLLAAVPGLAWMGWLWPPLKLLFLACGATSLWAIQLYATGPALAQGDIHRAEQVALLKYVLSSQSSILWMSCLFLLATLCYWGAWVSRTCAWLGRLLCWAGAWAGLSGLLVRWRESYLLGTDVGHLPVSNLYEVTVLLAVITVLFYLYYEFRYATRVLGGFVLPIVALMVLFLLWYSLSRDAHQIQPLVPALQSWWMKLHVPANFIGYGNFAVAGMIGFAYLIKRSAASDRTAQPTVRRLIGALLPAVLFALTAWWLQLTLLLYFLLPALSLVITCLFRQPIARQLPSLPVLDDMMYRAIALGFAFFTVATVLGALWAADAWGAYWQWDPKETWALIVWLNYAAWLHMRFMKGTRGAAAAYWAVLGVVITGFAFLGVNMFLSGLHSYGNL